MDGYVLFLSVLIAGSILGVAFFSSSEASLISVNKVRIRHLAEQGNSGAQVVARVVRQHEKFFATILLTENVFIIFSSIMAEKMANAVLGEQGLNILIATVVMTVLIVAFGEITPKSLAAQRSVGWSLVVARPIQVIMFLETWVIYLFTLLPRGISRLLPGENPLHAQTITEGELRILVDIGEAEGAVEAGGAGMLRRVLGFGDRTVRELMTPRTEIVWVEQGTSLQKFLGIYNEHYHTRFPVYQDQTDNVVGLISVKDVMRAYARGDIASDDSVTTGMRAAFFAPETKPVDELFDEMRVGGQQMAIVVDEFGGVEGLMTLKGLMERIMGPVGEEGEAPEEEEVVAIGEDSFEIDAGMRVEDANQRIGFGLPEGAYDTVAGFILERLGHVPEQGEQLTHESLHVQVLEMKGVKIERVLVTRSTPVGQ